MTLFFFPYRHPRESRVATPVLELTPSATFLITLDYFRKLKLASRLNISIFYSIMKQYNTIFIDFTVGEFQSRLFDHSSKQWNPRTH